MSIRRRTGRGSTGARSMSRPAATREGGADVELRQFNVTARRFDPNGSFERGKDLVLPVDSPGRRACGLGGDVERSGIHAQGGRRHGAAGRVRLHGGSHPLNAAICSDAQ